MNKLSNQELVNFVSEKIIEQGNPSINTDTGYCMYSFNGKCCAAGHLLSEEDKQIIHEELGCRDEYNEPIFDKYVEDTFFLRLLQSAHDNAAIFIDYNSGSTNKVFYTGEEFITRFKQEIRNICFEKNLAIPSCIGE